MNIQVQISVLVYTSTTQLFAVYKLQPPSSQLHSRSTPDFQYTADTSTYEPRVPQHSRRAHQASINRLLTARKRPKTPHYRHLEAQTKPNGRLNDSKQTNQPHQRSPVAQNRPRHGQPRPYNNTPNEPARPKITTYVPDLPHAANASPGEDDKNIPLARPYESHHAPQTTPREMDFKALNEPLSRPPISHHDLHASIQEPHTQLHGPHASSLHGPYTPHQGPHTPYPMPSHLQTLLNRPQTTAPRLDNRPLPQSASAAQSRRSSELLSGGYEKSSSGAFAIEIKVV